MVAVRNAYKILVRSFRPRGGWVENIKTGFKEIG
jgi:hypothetical protein